MGLPQAIAALLLVLAQAGLDLRCPCSALQDSALRRPYVCCRQTLHAHGSFQRV